MRARLSRDEAWRVLAASHTGILTTLRADGAPISLPVWFVVLDERVYVGTPAATKKVDRVRRDARVSFLVESGERWAELQGVHLAGRGLIVDDASVIARVRAALETKYASYRTAHADMPDATRRVYEASIAIIEIQPDDRILSWDNRRLTVL
jgi:PPOX class probable F420-dependent enzyme